MKYNIGDTFIDHNCNPQLKSSIFKIELENNKIYYWFRYNSGHRDTYWSEEEIDEMLNENVQYVPAIR